MSFLAASFFLFSRTLVNCRWRTVAALAASSVTALVAGAGPQNADSDAQLVRSFRSEIQPVLENYCYDCHGDGARKGGVALDELETGGKITDHAFWLRVLKNLRIGTMPPVDEVQPSVTEKNEIMAWIKQRAFALDPVQPDPGRVVARRLNRVEYRNTVRDLLGLEFDAETEFPADDSGHGFDNLGEVLTVSPTLVEKLMDAARKIVGGAVPARSREVAKKIIPGREFTRPPSADSAAPTPSEAPVNPEFAEYFEQLALASRDATFLSFYETGAVRNVYHAAHAGTYQLAFEVQTVERHFGSDGKPDLNRCRARFSVDGVLMIEREFERSGDRVFELPLEVALTEGDHVLEMAVEPLAGDASRGKQLSMKLDKVILRGPMEPAGWVKPERYREFFGEGVPADPAERRRYAAGILEKFTTRAFRRPADPAMIKRLVGVSETVAALPGNTLETGISHAMIAVLASPRFLFRIEKTEPLQPGEKYPLVDEYSLASRLSYFLWSSMPDDELLRLAGEHRLRANFSAQFARMLVDVRAKRFVADFTGQWLQARDVPNVVIDPLSVALRDRPDPKVEKAREVFRSLIEADPINYTPEEKTAFEAADAVLKEEERRSKPRLTGRVRRGMKQETEDVFAYILKEDRSVLELVDSDYTFLNEDLARHYGIDGVKGSEMRKVTLPSGSLRGGVLTSGTVLTVTSNPTRTSPVKRGLFILDNILGMPPAPPPPNIPPLEAVNDKNALHPLSMRESIARHASDSLCRSCHLRMDPLGLALENFNALGVQRTAELDQPVDPSGQLITGEKFKDIGELKHILVSPERRRDFYYCLSEKLLIYALGRGPDYTDTTLLDHLVERLESTHGRMSALLTGLVESSAFQQTRLPVSDSNRTVAANPRMGVH